MAKFKGILSVTLLVGMILITATGAPLFFFKGGMVIGIPRAYLTGAHALLAAVIAVCVVVHFILNLKVLCHELRRTRRK